MLGANSFQGRGTQRPDWASATVVAAQGSQESTWPLVSSVMPDATLPKGFRSLGPSIDSYHEFKDTKQNKTPFFSIHVDWAEAGNTPLLHLSLKHTNAE